ncbi:unnamed protein product [Symbiodinium natans]|uniref:Uncharacterized protein n=1 Tax=Symbiodinium natans TaxID=878477 RepID=A0A812VBY9_9DINO|nr:unnamed protein product [Symbiodinium natans]
MPSIEPQSEAGLRRKPRTCLKAVLLPMVAFVLAPFGHAGALSFVASPSMASRVGSRSRTKQFLELKAAREELDLNEEDGDEGDEDFFEGEEAGLAKLAADPGDALSERQSKADVARQRLWNMPKDVTPYMQVETVTYQNKEKLARTRNLVVLKAKNSKAMLQKSQKIIKQGTLSSIRMKRLKRYGRGEFGRDNALQWNRPGRRAFRMRSGMKDLRYADDLERSQRRKKDLRPVDWKNKRRRPGQGEHKKRWIGSSFRYGRGTTISRR